MKTITITITTNFKDWAGETKPVSTVYRANAERWTDFVQMRRMAGPPLDGLDEDMMEQLCWHQFRARMYAEERGYAHEEQIEGAHKGGESR